MFLQVISSYHGLLLVQRGYCNKNGPIRNQNKIFASYFLDKVKSNDPNFDDAVLIVSLILTSEYVTTRVYKDD